MTHRPKLRNGRMESDMYYFNLSSSAINKKSTVATVMLNPGALAD